MSDLKDIFFEHVAQTSPAPIGLEIARAEGSWLYCTDGRRYLDFIAGIGVSALGHGHPAILRAIEEQARRHLHVMVYGEYVIEAQVKLAARLSDLLPRGLSRVYFTNSGAEAIEAALKLARKHTRRAGFVAFDGAYHGDTMAALALMGNPAFRAPFEPLPGPVRRLPYNDVDALAAIDPTIAAVVIEPVQAEAGVRIPDARFMRALRERCDAGGALLVFDEVLTGFGRTGQLFAAEHFGVTPDIMVLAKALGGGLPIGALCARDELLAEFSHDPPLGHITTFGGHPLSCAAGLASLEAIVTDHLPERARVVGESIIAKLKSFEAPEIADVRGIGLLIGIEFHEAVQAHRFVAASLANGVVINWTLNAEKVVRLAPPLNIASHEVDFALDAMWRALNSIRVGRA
ncbi:MAG TPA: aminotransferase class III-fold pyridoxal phosphate-dependent enzyme [Candidatus Binataceae bacterium]|nr:aminotransferase class III-fold pyridoxal phosphate-dependent enzyme [Candidatus Binataceae bacterium]